jgi:tetratricopeptide (TPR) repeat protein
MALSYLGDAHGATEIERALDALLEAGAGVEAATAYNNLAWARYPLEGPARSLLGYETGIDFCRQRGLVISERVLAANCASLLVELGRADEALASATHLAGALEASGQTTDLVELRAVELWVGAARGNLGSRAAVAWILSAAREVQHVDITALAPAVAASALAPHLPEDARAALAELEHAEGAERSPHFARQLSAVVRAALSIRDRELAERLIAKLEPRYPLNEHALCAGRAQISEHAGELENAVALYGEAASRWQQFGNVPERAYALLGQGRCLSALGKAQAEEPLREARELFASMGYRPALAETEALLGESEAAAV